MIVSVFSLQYHLTADYLQNTEEMRVFRFYHPKIAFVRANTFHAAHFTKVDNKSTPFCMTFFTLNNILSIFPGHPIGSHEHIILNLCFHPVPLTKDQST